MLKNRKTIVAFMLPVFIFTALAMLWESHFAFSDRGIDFSDNLYFSVSFFMMFFVEISFFFNWLFFTSPKEKITSNKKLINQVMMVLNVIVVYVFLCLFVFDLISYYTGTSGISESGKELLMMLLFIWIPACWLGGIWAVIIRIVYISMSVFDFLKKKKKERKAERARKKAEAAALATEIEK